MSVKRRRAMLASNPMRNSRPELIATMSRACWTFRRVLTGSGPDRNAAPAQVLTTHRPIDSAMPEKTHGRFHACAPLARRGSLRSPPAPVAERRVKSFLVVHPFDEVLNGSPCFCQIAVLLAVHFVVFERLHERFAECVVVRVSLPAHADRNLIFSADRCSRRKRTGRRGRNDAPDRRR